MNSEFRRWGIVLLLWRRVRFRRTNLRMITRGSNSCKRWAGMRARASELLLKALSIPSESKQIKTFTNLQFISLCWYHQHLLSSLFQVLFVTCVMSLGLGLEVTESVSEPTLAPLMRMTMSSTHTERGWCSHTGSDRTLWTTLGGNTTEWSYGGSDY